MLKNNLIGQILIGLMVLFLLISSVQMFGLGQSLSEIVIDEENQPNIPSVPKGVIQETVDYKAENKQFFENITKRPMFNQSRTPFVAVEEDPVDEEPATEVGELKAKLTGVVITPEQSYAMILDNLTNERVTYKIGMPLEGEQGGWTLTEIYNRKVVFVSDDDKSEELELEVYGASKITKAATKKVAATPKGKVAEPQSRADKKKNADDIRKKIAERRAQMRAEAANKK